MMRTPRPWLLSAVAVILAANARAEDPIPTPLPAARYEKMRGHSPFAPPTVTAGPVASVAPATVSWAEKLTATLVMQDGGKYIATVIDKDTQEHFLVTSDAENARGLLLSGVQWAEKVADTKITLRKGVEFGQVNFDPSASISAAPMPAPATSGKPPIPGASNVFRPPPAPNNPAQPGGIRRPPIRAVPTVPAVQPPRPTPARMLNKPPVDDDDDDD